MTHGMLDRARFFAPWQMAGCSPSTPVLLAFSGGADSVALLRLLTERREIDGFPLTLAHVNHNIRGEEALRDRDFCCACAKRYGVEICILDADVPAYAHTFGMGLEEAARAVRYDFFAKIMKEKNIPLLVTAHHADDHLETLLFRLSRGTGTRGLCGIAPARPFANGTLVRPLLPFSKNEILAFCQEMGLSFVTDSTNFDPAYARNRIRTDVTPVLESLFSGVAARSVELSRNLREDDMCLESLATAFLRAHLQNGRLPLATLREQPIAIIRRVLSAWAYETCGALEATHLQALMKIVLGDTPMACVALPRGQYAFAREEMLCVGERPTPFAHYQIPFAFGQISVGDSGITICVAKTEEPIKKVHNLSTLPYTILTVGFDIIKSNVYWRSRVAGDRILLRGMHRKLRKLYAEAGVSPYLRERIPLLCDDDGVLWAPLVGVRDGVREEVTGVRIKLSLPDTYTVRNKAATPTGGNRI